MQMEDEPPENELIRPDWEKLDKGIVGQIRERLRQGKIDNRLPKNGVSVAVKDLTYTSPILHTEISTVFTYMRHIVNIHHRIQDFIKPSPKKQQEILSHVNFKIPDKSMTLVIGSPGSGKVSNFYYHI